MRYNLSKRITPQKPAVPLSLRLPAPLESQIVDYALRAGVNKTTVIVKSVQEFLARNAQPSAFKLYEDVMRSAAPSSTELATDQHLAPHLAPDLAHGAKEQRPHKLQVREAMRGKHAQRSIAAKR